MSWTVKSSYFEKGTVQWIVCIEKKSVCLKYANVVLLLYDALNLIDNLVVNDVLFIADFPILLPFLVHVACSMQAAGRRRAADQGHVTALMAAWQLWA